MRDGDEDAFGELYRRHIDVARGAARSLLSWAPEAEDVVSDAFTRVLSILQRGGGPEEAFRPYLLTCVRHACYDRSQGIARSQPVDPVDMADLAHARQRGELDPGDGSNNSDLLARAFASLPERWQLVLWSTEVDGRRPPTWPRSSALRPGAVASLAYRAREGLTEAFLSAHLQRPSAPACAAIRPRLAAFVRDNVGGREEAAIQAHLDQCTECQDLVGELRELNRPLRGLLVPAVTGMSAAAYLAEPPPAAAACVPRLLQFLHARPVFSGAAAASVAVLAGATMTGVVPLQAVRWAAADHDRGGQRRPAPIPSPSWAAPAAPGPGPGPVPRAGPARRPVPCPPPPAARVHRRPAPPCRRVPGGPGSPAGDPAVAPVITVPGAPGATPTVTVPGVTRAGDLAAGGLDPGRLPAGRLTAPGLAPARLAAPGEPAAGERAPDRRARPADGDPARDHGAADHPARGDGAGGDGAAGHGAAHHGAAHHRAGAHAALGDGAHPPPLRPPRPVAGTERLPVTAAVHIRCNSVTRHLLVTTTRFGSTPRPIRSARSRHDR